MNSSFRDGTQYAFDSTSLGWFQKCPRYYQYKMIEGWQPKRKSPHLVFGGHYARALELYYKHRATGLDSGQALLQIVRYTMEATWEDGPEEDCRACKGFGTVLVDTGTGYDPHPCPVCIGIGRVKGTPWTSTHNTKTRENLIRSIVWYVDQFENEEITVVHLADGKPAVELSFTFEPEPGILFCGHIDRLVDYGGNKYVMDQKTTGGTIASYFFDQFSPDMQFSMYSYAGQVIFDTKVKGVIVDGAQIAVGFTRFERGFVHRTDEQLDEWLENTLTLAHNTQEATRTNHFVMNTQSCGMYGGCEFRAVCSRSPGVRKNFLEADFTQEPRWSPLDRR